MLEDWSMFYVIREVREEYKPEILRPTFRSGRTTLGVQTCFCKDEIRLCVYS